MKELPGLISVNAFVELAQASEIVLPGYIAFNEKDPTCILYGRHQFRCPETRIPRDQILGIQVGEMHRCEAAQAEWSPRHMWFALVHLQSAKTEEGKAFQELLMQLASEPQTRASEEQQQSSANCGCSGGAEDIPFWWCCRRTGPFGNVSRHNILAPDGVHALNLCQTLHSGGIGYRVAPGRC